MLRLQGVKTLAMTPRHKPQNLIVFFSLYLFLLLLVIVTASDQR